MDIPEAIRLLESGEPPSRTVALSFDDGFADVAERALLVLAGHGFRATVFVATAVTDGRTSFSWYDRQLPVLGWDEIVVLDRGGTFDFEAHSLTHPNLLRLDDEAARQEIAGSRAELQERLGRPVTVFCHPAGLFSERERRLAQEAGFAAAVSCEPGAKHRRHRSLRPAQDPDRPARPPDRLPGQAVGRVRQTAAAARSLPAASLLKRRRTRVDRPGEWQVENGWGSTQACPRLSEL